MAEAFGVFTVAANSIPPVENFVPDSVLSSGQLRLFSILPGEDDQQLEIVLATFSISSKEDQYVAISYAWESTSLTHEIILNGKRAKITANLYQALSQLRRDDRYNLFWADAICIHQSNVDEKTQQVRNMSRIFHNAKLVIIWLGIDDETTATGLELLQKIDDASDEFKLASEGQNLDNDFNVYKKVELPPFQSPDWRAVGNIYRRSWFSRAWILRELAEAKKSLMMIGGYRADTQLVIRAMNRICSNEALTVPLTNEEFWPVLQYGPALMMFMVEPVKSVDTFLPKLLFISRAFLCTEPRDRYFAIGDCSSSSMAQFIDYEHSIEQIIVLAAIRSVKQHSSAVKQHEAIFLMLSMIDGRYISPGVPSWCPTYNCAKEFSSFAMYWGPGKGYCGPEPQPFNIDQENKLLLTGRCFDTVASHIESPQELKTERKSMEQVGGNQVIHRISKMSLELEEKCYALAMKTLNDIAETKRKDMYLHCVTAGRPQPQNSDGFPLQDLAESHESMKYQWKMNDTMQDYADLPKPQRFTEFLKHFPELQQKVIEQGTSDDPRSTLMQETNRLIIESKWISQARVFSWSGRKFCSTTDGRIGFVPDAAETGDRICFFNGWDVPFVLRQVSRDRPGEYQVMGACYIEGLMYGAAFDEFGIGEDSIKIV